MERKKEIREQLLRLREAQDALDWQRGTEKIAKEVVDHPWFRETTDIYCYLDINGEVGTRPIIEEAWRLGKVVWVPKVTGTNIAFYQMDAHTQLARGPFGIMEPSRGTPAKGSEGLVIVPGVGFDRNRNRLGYGKGYYDRYLQSHSKLRTIAVAFDLQLVDEIPADKGDIRPDILVTETITIGNEVE